MLNCEKVPKGFGMGCKKHLFQYPQRLTAAFTHKKKNLKKSIELRIHILKKPIDLKNHYTEGLTTAFTHKN